MTKRHITVAVLVLVLLALTLACIDIGDLKSCLAQCETMAAFNNWTPEQLQACKNDCYRRYPR